jgi:hypothetical protein
MALKPQDVVVVLKLVALNGKPLSRANLGRQLHLSSSTVHASLKRAKTSGLIDERGQPVGAAIWEFFRYGFKYVFAVEAGNAATGMPTSWAGPRLGSSTAFLKQPRPVWPSSEGSVEGIAFPPLYPGVPLAAKEDGKLYELLALADTLRDPTIPGKEHGLALWMLKSRVRKARARSQDWSRSLDM